MLFDHAGDLPDMGFTELCVRGAHKEFGYDTDVFVGRCIFPNENDGLVAGGAPVFATTQHLVVLSLANSMFLAIASIYEWNIFNASRVHRVAAIGCQIEDVDHHAFPLDTMRPNLQPPL